MTPKLYTIHRRAEYYKIHIVGTKNNTFISISTGTNHLLQYWSSGKLKIKGSKKKTSYASESIIRELTKQLKHWNVQRVILYVNGTKRKLLSSLQLLIGFLTKNNTHIIKIQYNTPVPYNGTKGKKIRRV